MANRKHHHAWHSRRRPLRDFNARLAEALFAADDAARARDLAAAERWARLADRISALALRMKCLPAPLPAQEEDVETLRAELRRRFERIVGVSLAEAPAARAGEDATYP